MLRRVSSRWLLVSVLAVSLPASLLVAQTSGAQESAERRWRPPPARPFTVQLEDEYGRTLRTFVHHGKTFVLGEFGERYNIRVQNPTSVRVEAVVTVDGRDVVSGSPGDFVKNRGYLIAAGGSIVIEGFRTSLHEVAAFRFTNPGNSYSSRMGTPENVGVIGVAFFTERVRKPVVVVPRPQPTPRASPKPKARAPSESRSSGRTEASEPARERHAQNLGTEFGEAHSSHVTQVRFERQNPTRPTRIVTLRYDDASGLEARGIEVFDELGYEEFEEPDPFPNNRFAPPPPAR